MTGGGRFGGLVGVALFLCGVGVGAVVEVGPLGTTLGAALPNGGFAEEMYFSAAIWKVRKFDAEIGTSGDHSAETNHFLATYRSP